MLDVITLVSTSTPPEWLRGCRRTVSAAADYAGFRVRHIEAPAIPGHIGAAMAAALEKATADYVCWVDDDDFVLPNAFRCLASHFSAKPAAICARELQLLANGRLVPSHARHHLTAYERGALRCSNLEDFAAYPNLRALAHAEREGTVMDELSWVYIYRQRRSDAAGLRAAHRDEVGRV